MLGLITACRLALMAWPLAIAAIDVNLARTHEEIVQRTEKMSCLGEIYKHFTSVADVTSFVTTGAKQILHLANMTVHQLLLRDQALSPTPISHCQNPADRPYEFTDDPMGNRNHTLVDWVEVFNHYPEVYLLISKSTDYALSWGRLPDYDKIPGCLLQSEGLGYMNLRLPWIMSLDGEDNTRIQPSESLDGSSSEAYQQKAGPTAHDFTTIDPSEGILGYQQTPESFQPSQNDKDQRNAQNSSQSFEGWLSSDFGIPDMPRNTDLEEPFEEFDRYAQPQEIDFNLREEDFSEAFQSSFMSTDGYNGYGPFDFRDAYFEPELWSGF